MSYVVSHNYGKIKIDSDNDLPLDETLTLHDVAILLRSVFNKNQNEYYYNVFLENFLNQLAKKKEQKKLIL